MNRFGTGLTSNHLNKIEYNQLSWIDKLKIGNVSVHYLSSCLLFQRPRAFDGFTQIVANNRGHLLPGVKRSRESPWGNFVGTYDMPLKIPGTKWNPSYSCQTVFTGVLICVMYL